MHTQTPKLRFPEFSDNWEVKKLGEIAEISSGGTPSRAKKEYWNGNIPWVSTTLIDFNIIDKTEEQITEEGLKKSSAKLFPKGTLLMAMYGQGKTRGKIAILGIKASTNQACGAIMPNNSILNNIFLFQNLAKRYDEIRDLSNQGGQENLSGGIIKGLDISLPQLPEQTKIANFLTAIDAKIQALKQKKTLLEQYKKGIMQQIFSQELRFKNDDSSDFDDWEEKSLGEICEVITKGTTPRQFSNQGVKFIKTECFNEKGIDELKCLFVNEEIHNKELKRSILKENDILFAIAGSIGKVRIVKKNILPANTNQALSIIRLKEKEIVRFIFYILTSINMEKYILDNITVGAQPNLNLEQMNNYCFNYPSLPEQQKIADFLTAIDEKIEKVSQQITATETYKKGLLQQMFI